jgi:dnd system-associated protein 4
MSTVWLPTEHSELLERLAKSTAKSPRKPLFATYMHLMVFAAMVGHSISRKRDVLGTGRGSEISESAFLNNGLDGVVYLIALQEYEDGEILREGKDQECWRVIEQYAAVGLDEIASWLLDNPTDSDGVSTILNKIKEAARLDDGVSTILDPGTSVFG